MEVLSGAAFNVSVSDDAKAGELVAYGVASATVRALTMQIDPSSQPLQIPLTSVDAPDDLRYFIVSVPSPSRVIDSLAIGSTLVFTAFDDNGQTIDSYVNKRERPDVAVP